jgi:ABC-type multidrug transport system fused ATPase/permease subunit
VSWLAFIRRGLSRVKPTDRVAIPGREAGGWANLEILRPSVRKHWRIGALAAGLLLLGVLVNLPIPLVTRFLVDEVILNKQLGLLFGAAAVLVVLKLGTMLAGPVQQYTFTRFEQAVLLDFQESLLSRALRLPMDFFDRQEVGYLVERLGADVNGVRWFFSSAFVTIATSALTFVGGVFMLYYLEWRLATVAVIGVPALFLAMRFFSRKARILSHARMEQKADVTERLQETLSAIPLVRAFAAERRESGRIIESVRKSFDLSLEQLTVGSLSNLSISAISGLASFSVLIAGAILVIRDQWTLGSLLAFQLYLGFVYGPARVLASSIMPLQGAMAALERLAVFFDQPPEQAEGHGQRVIRLEGVVEFRDVAFRYDDKGWVLHNLSFTARPGQYAAIIGHSGIGKTTLLKLLLGFYRPQAGEVLIDGTPVTDYHLPGLRSRIGYVSQNTTLLSGTIAENLRYGRTDATDEELVAAARAAGIDDFIQGLPGGYAERVGERGANLSAGQQQRLALARALVKDPDILILDEPTSALDLDTARKILDSMPGVTRGKTVLIVTHDPAIAGQADQVIDLDSTC